MFARSIFSVSSLVGISMFLAASCATAQQQNYPSKLVRLVLPVAPGGGTDILARTIAPELSTRLGQSVIVDNRGAGSGIVGIEHVARSAPDGHTIMLMTSAFTILPSLQPALPYDSLRDFHPLTRISSVPHVLVTNPSLPVRSVQELIALAKARPDQITFASQATGSSSHLSAELFKTVAGVRMTHVPYKGASFAVTALVSGEVSVLFSVPMVSLPHIRSSRLRLLAVTSAERSRLFPDTPSVHESGLKNFEAIQWHGIWLPAGAPAQVTERLGSEFGTIIALPAIVERMRAEGADPVKSTPREFGAFVSAEITKWAKVIRASGAKAY